MSLLLVLAAASLLLGAALHISMSVFVAGAAAILAWLLAFGVREGLSRLKQH
ncbi:hypothetical protein ABIA32_001020 [Streptacidiphilus sp. MAP12-20]|uniref:hypothetical protein n=1 Tax=Streptacidiphilus sp. MAP12-20 TaxID=3156299 RepID=UPI0035193D1A